MGEVSGHWDEEGEKEVFDPALSGEVRVREETGEKPKKEYMIT